jgi:hypothetical protein
MSRAVRAARWSVAVALAGMCVTGGCALNRAEVKSLRDPDASRVQFAPAIATTISALNALPVGCGSAGNRRRRSEEFRVYEVSGRITRIREERDHDIHVVLADLDYPREHMIVEFDDPDFRKNVLSPERERIAAARRMLNALASGSSDRSLSSLKGLTVKVSGVGFFDINHFQSGRSRSCIELHPVTAIERLSP